jgi:hypothetical protein
VCIKIQQAFHCDDILHFIMKDLPCECHVLEDKDKPDVDEQ